MRELVRERGNRSTVIVVLLVSGELVAPFDSSYYLMDITAYLCETCCAVAADVAGVLG